MLAITLSTLRLRSPVPLRHKLPKLPKPPSASLQGSPQVIAPHKGPTRKRRFRAR